MEHAELTGRAISLSTDLKDSYAVKFASLANDPQIPRLIGSHGFPCPYREEDALNFFHMNRQTGKEVFAMDFLVFHEGELVGVIGLKDIDHQDRKAHVGYWIGKEFRSRGIASEALELVCQFSLETLKLNRLYTRVLENNPASMKVLLKNGFSIEGYERDSMFLDGKFISMFLFGRILG